MAPARRGKTHGAHGSRGAAFGRTIGHYALGKTIGEGTFGKVKAGTHVLTGERVAIKILEKSKIVELVDVQRVAREIKILKRNLHMNVIQLFEVLDTPTTIFLIMENADGGEMFDYIVKHQRVPETQACYFFHQIIDGLDYLHTLEVTHRDLKPENLLLQKSKQGLLVKIVDFGLSNTHDGGRLLSTACGSPCYAAPEMIAGKQYKGPCADIWSLGVILFALVCGYLPFEDANTSNLYRKILAGSYSLPKWVSTDARDLIKRILNTNPDRRYTIEDIRKHRWYNQIQLAAAKGLSNPRLEDLNETAILQAQKLGISRENVIKSVLAGAHNNPSTTYHLLCKRIMREANAQPQPRVEQASGWLASVPNTQPKSDEPSRRQSRREPQQQRQQQTQPRGSDRQRPCIPPLKLAEINQPTAPVGGQTSRQSSDSATRAAPSHRPSPRASAHGEVETAAVPTVPNHRQPRQKRLPAVPAPPPQPQPSNHPASQAHAKSQLRGGRTHVLPLSGAPPATAREPPATAREHTTASDVARGQPAAAPATARQPQPPPRPSAQAPLGKAVAVGATTTNRAVPPPRPLEMVTATPLAVAASPAPCKHATTEVGAGSSKPTPSPPSASAQAPAPAPNTRPSEAVSVMPTASVPINVGASEAPSPDGAALAPTLTVESMAATGARPPSRSGNSRHRTRAQSTACPTTVPPPKVHLDGVEPTPSRPDPAPAPSDPPMAVRAPPDHADGLRKSNAGVLSLAGSVSPIAVPSRPSGARPNGRHARPMRPAGKSSGFRPSPNGVPAAARPTPPTDNRTEPHSKLLVTGPSSQPTGEAPKHPQIPARPRPPMNARASPARPRAQAQTKQVVPLQGRVGAPEAPVSSAPTSSGSGSSAPHHLNPPPSASAVVLSG